MFGARGRASPPRPAHSIPYVFVPILAAGLGIAGCTDESGITPPDPRLAVGPSSNQLTVTTTEDTETCDPAPGDCSLRGALLAANDNPEGGPYTIVLASGETYLLTIDALRVEAAVTIEGNGATVEQATDWPVFTVFGVGSENPVQLTLEKVTVTGSTDGGIHVSSAVLTLSNATVTGNHNRDAGGGIYANNSTVVLTNSIVSDNTTDSHGGGIFGRDSDLTLTNSVVAGNRALDDTTVPSGGGGIYSTFLEGDRGSLTLMGSTVSDNASAASGGGIRAARSALIVNSTVSGNMSDGWAGGIYSINNTTTTLVNSTVTRNAAVEGGGIYSFGSSGEITLSNTIVADQESGPDCSNHPEFGGTITSLGHNLDSDDSCGLTAEGDRPSGDADLGPLGDNGGITPTHALVEQSDAIGAGDDDVCASEPVNAIDQRAVQRPQGTSCDIGAFEREEPEDLAIVTDALPDGRVGEPYSATLEASGGTRPYTWGTLAGGGVPDGLRLPVTGQISGTPTEAGTFEIGVVVFDSGEPGRSAERDLSLTIAPNTHELTVTLAGTGGGRVTSAPAGIDCGDECVAPFEAGTEVTLTAVAGEDSEFTGWSGGACSGGASTIAVTMSDARACTATFDLVPVATTLEAEPALLKVEGGLLGLRLRLLDLSGRLTRVDTGAPLQGQTVTMRVGRQGGGGREICSAVTDADGVATCSGELSSLLGLVLSGYTATFSGSQPFEPSSADAPLISIEAP